MVRKSYTAFAETLNNFVRKEITKQNNFIANNALIYKQSYNLFKGVPNANVSVISSIRDPVDNVMYFMVGFDRVGSPSKIGV